MFSVCTFSQYHYHHLFGDLLRVRLQQHYTVELPNLNLRADEWPVDHDDHHWVIHYLEPDRSISAAHVLIGYAQVM